MSARYLLASAALCLAAAAAAQPRPAPPRPAQAQAQPQGQPQLQQLLSAGYDLKAVLASTAPCGNQPGNRTEICRRELYFLQSPRKDIVFRCERGTWNGTALTDCTRL